MPASAVRRKLNVVEPSPSHASASAARTLDLETEGLAALRAALAEELGPAFNRAVTTLAAPRAG